LFCRHLKLSEFTTIVLHIVPSDNEFFAHCNKPNLIHVHKWLELGRKAKEYTLSNITDKHTTEDKLRITEKISIKHQLENLLTYPEVFKRVEEGKLGIHGWYYRIEDGSIECYNGEENIFKPL